MRWLTRAARLISYIHVPEKVKADSLQSLSLLSTNGWGGGASGAGVIVTADSAMRHSAFWACIKLVSSSVASLPLPVYRMASDGTRTLARDSALYNVVHDSPNADQTAFDFWEFVSISLLLRGNHYSRKIFGASGRFIGLDPINPDLVTVRRLPSGAIGYHWTMDGKNFDLTDRDVFHIRGFGGGPLGGLSTISYARETLGIAIAANNAAGGSFGNGMQPSGTLEFDKFLTDEQFSLTEERLATKFVGSENTGKPLILEGGVKWKQISLSNEDAQLLESRAFSVEEICRIVGVPPFMIGHSEKSTSWGTGIEQQLLGFLKFTLTPILRRIEQSISKQLLTPAERLTLNAEFNVEGLLRPDSKGRSEFYRTMTSIGAMTVNEVRAKENLAPVEGGDVARVQMQNVPLGTEPENGNQA